MNQARYTSIDDLQAQTSLHDAAAKCGTVLDAHGTGRQVRLDCPFNCPGDHAGRRELSVDTGNPQKVFACHAYECQFRGNLLTLMHGWLTGTRPTNGSLRGAEFQRVRSVLAGQEPPATKAPGTAAAAREQEKQAEAPKNVPLEQHENEKARDLVTLDEKFLRDVAHMPPAAASYVRKHPCLTTDAMLKWRVGVLPQDGGSDKRGWSVRGQLLYPVLSEDGKLLAWVARDPQFEAKEQTFKALSPDERAKEKPPAKHRFPVDFHRGQELFGQHASRLQEPGYREAISSFGIIVVEGFNGVIGLDAINVPAVAIMSNKMTEGQIAKIERFAKRLASGRVSLLFDADDAGDEGAKEALWLLSQRGLDVRLAWTKAMHGGQFAGRQPESLTREEWEQAIRTAIVR